MIKRAWTALLNRFSSKKTVPPAPTPDLRVDLNGRTLQEAAFTLVAQHHHTCAPFETFFYDCSNVRLMQPDGSVLHLGSFRIVVLPLREDAFTQSPLDSQERPH